MRARFVNEAKQVGILYHYTTFDAAEQIINEGRIRSDVHGATGTLDDPRYLISFTRDKNFHKTSRALTYSGNTLHCRFVINGDKLSSNFKIVPYAQEGFEKGTKDFEAEEMIYEKKPVSVSLDRYLIRLDILTMLKKPRKNDWGYDFEWDMYGKQFENIFELSKEKGIPINLVDKIGNPIDYKEKRNFLNKLFKR